MTADTRIEPVGHVNGSIRTNSHIARAEHHLEGLLAAAAALEIGTRKSLLRIAGQEVEALELEISSIGFGQVAEDHIAPGFAAQQQAPVFLAQGTLLVKGDARGRSAPVDIPRRHRARIFLTPLGHRRALARTPISTPGALAIQRAETRIAILHQESRAARRRIIVVVLEDIAVGGDRLLVAVTEIVADNVNARSIGIHAGSEAPDPHMAVVAPLSRNLRRVPAQLRIARAVGAADAEGLARTIGEHRSAVAGVPVPLSIGTHGDAVNGVIVALAVEPSEDHLALIDRGIKLSVAVHVGVNDDVRSHRNDHLVADHGHTHRGSKRRFLNKDALLVGHAVPV